MRVSKNETGEKEPKWSQSRMSETFKLDVYKAALFFNQENLHIVKISSSAVVVIQILIRRGVRTAILLDKQKYQK